MIKRCFFIMLILAAFTGIMVLFACGRQKVHCVTGINNLDRYYILEFENMNREESCIIPVGKDDVFAVNFRIDKGCVDFIIGIDGKSPICKGNTGSKNKLITELSTLQVPEALNLAWKVFQEYESPDYSQEGTEEFRRCLHDKEYLNGITYFGAYDEEKLVGLVGIRLKEGHICFFFVDGAYHRRGIGRSLFEFVKSRVYVRPITLNSSPYGLPFYNALGFKAVSAEQTVNGIRFTPMVFDEKTKMMII